MSTKLRDPREIIREEPLMHLPILQALKTGPLTVPEIAQHIGQPANEVLFWVMGMRRYGHIVEVEDATDEGHFRYASVRKEATS
jgi:predicted Rossmann fold nucleotide-binding protein DprA/Smf involved in DNA uptake